MKYILLRVFTTQASIHFSQSEYSRQGAFQKNEKMILQLRLTISESAQLTPIYIRHPA